MDGGLIVMLLWSGLVLGAYGHAFVNRVRKWHRYRDERTQRDLNVGIALLLCAVGAVGSVVLGLLFPGVALRGLFSALALGGFLGAGIVLATEESPEKE